MNTFCVEQLAWMFGLVSYNQVRETTVTILTSSDLAITNLLFQSKSNQTFVQLYKKLTHGWKFTLTIGSGGA